MFYNLPQVFPEHRFEIQFIGDIEIGTYGFGITVHHNGFVAGFSDGHQSMHTTIIEFDALPNAVRARSKHDDFFAIGANAFVA